MPKAHKSLAGVEKTLRKLLAGPENKHAEAEFEQAVNRSLAILLDEVHHVFVSPALFRVCLLSHHSSHSGHSSANA
jgi:hypothetical protein